AEGFLSRLQNRGWGSSRKVRVSRGKRTFLWSTPPETVSKRSQTMRVSSQTMRIRASSGAKPTKTDHSKRSLPLKRRRDGDLGLVGEAHAEPLREDRRRGLRGGGFGLRSARDARPEHQKRDVAVVVVGRAVRGAGSECCRGEVPLLQH